MKRVLFVCVENAGRSQMAEAFANHYGEDKLSCTERGNKIGVPSQPVVVEVMAEKGIDISQNKPKMLTQAIANEADLIVTMGCGGSDFCPGPFFKEDR